MRTKTSLPAMAIILGGLLVAGAAISFPVGVPVAALAPLSCTTPSGAWTITLVPKSPGVGTIPYAEPCLTLPGNSGKTCSVYKYAISGETPSHILFAASADQDLDALNPGNLSSVAVPGAGDTVTGFLTYAKHEYAIRLNPTPGVPVELWFVGGSKPRLSTVVINKGRTTESCLIAGPGVAGDPFQPITLTQSVLAAGGKCAANLIYDAAGNVVDVTTNTPGCFVGSPTVARPLLINGEPLRNNTNPHGITFGNGTSTCYGPPVPSIPKCICTAAPCP